jgi:hypothetical protein
MISIMKPRQWRVHNVLSKLPCHFFTYPYVFLKTHIFPLTRSIQYLRIYCLNLKKMSLSRRRTVTLEERFHDVEDGALQVPILDKCCQQHVGATYN